MSGIKATLDIARNAMSTHQYGMSIAGHNIANVNTEGYTRQSPVNLSNTPQMMRGQMFGRGVALEEIRRVIDKNLEGRLMDYKSGLACAKEMEKYGRILDGLLSETENNGLGVMLADFWNMWEDMSLNPSGAAERSVLYEKSLGLAQHIKDLDQALASEETNIVNSLNLAVDAINILTGQIANLNRQIAQIHSAGIAPNDLRDQRNILLTELAQYIDTKHFEQSDGSITVSGPRGCVLVLGAVNFDLGVNENDVIYGPSSARELTITDYIEKGKIGGWLKMRDEILSQLRGNLDEMSKELIFSVNSLHSQGVGITAFDSVTGSVIATATDKAIGSVNSGLFFSDRVVDGQFKLWVYDAAGAVVNAGGTNIVITANTTAMDQIAAAIDAVDPNISASTVTGQLVVSTASDYTFAFSSDTSNALAAMGVNTFFDGTGSSNIGICQMIELNRDMIAAGQVDPVTGNISSGDNANAVALADLKYTNLNITEWHANRIGSDTQATNTVTIEEYYQSLISTLGASLSTTERERLFTESMVQNLSTVRGSISGVSLDEEMTNLIELQHAYAAAAKLITTMDEIFQTLLSIK